MRILQRLTRSAAALFISLMLVAGLVLLWGEAPMQASYTTVTFDRQTVDGNGLHLYFTITGNAGEAPYQYRLDIVDPGPGLAARVNDALFAQIQNLNRQQTVIAAMPTPGTTIVVTPPPSDPASTFGAFRASATFTPGATPQDVCGIAGSGGKTVTVTSMELASTQTTAGVNGWVLLKRSTLNTAGTTQTPTTVALSPVFPAGTAAVRTYTANPTAGTLVGTIWSGVVASPAPATATTSLLGQRLDFDKPGLTLGPTDLLAWNFNGAALPTGLSVRCTIAWTEQ